MRLLLAEDDESLGADLQARLREQGYAVDWARDGVEAAWLGSENVHDLVVLDIGLPGKDGLAVLREWRERGLDLPVLLLTARDAWFEKVEGFEAGADDYLAKPFHFEELSARLRALSRRASEHPADLMTPSGGLALDEAHQQAVVDGQPVELTGTEFRLLRYLVHHAGHVLSKSRLAEHLYEFDDDRDPNVIEAYVTRLRRKLGRERIETRRGQGYVFHRDPRERS
ncbi:response regulator [Guyparkeria halophila]|uniref:Response regulator n=1 Tax=Guyparkeria halophila TaxID=47960 RepID=A0A6I6D2P7_9GAMM|nr:response regulator transcription factor [Guyparkeria halophila]QGT78193.1 response regulator [Guyparkeria halophila]